MNDYSADTASLAPIMEPESIPYTFDTLGWYLVAVLVFLVLVGLAFAKWKTYKRNAYRREAEKIVKRVVSSNAENPYYSINKLLKLIAIDIYGRREVANLYGEEWFSYLVSKLDGPCALPSLDFDAFSQAIYHDDAEVELDLFSEFALVWINHHQR